MLDTMASWFSVSDALTRVAVMVCVVCVTGGQLGAVQGPVKTYSFEGVESIRVVQCDGVGNDVIGVKIYESERESRNLVIAGDKKSGLICTTNSSFTACTAQRGDISKNISVRIIITDLEPGEVREYTCGINRETGDGAGSTAAKYHHINVTRPEVAHTPIQLSPTKHLGPMKTGSFKGVESIRVVQCDGVGNDVIGVKIYERASESKVLVSAGEKDSGFICVTNSSFSACTVQRGDFSKNIFVRVIITDLEPGEVREYTCGIKRETGDGIGLTAAHYHYIHVTRPVPVTKSSPTTPAAADQSSYITAYIIVGVLTFALVSILVIVIVIVILVRRNQGGCLFRCLRPRQGRQRSENRPSNVGGGSQQYTAVQQNDDNCDNALNNNVTEEQPAPSTSDGQGSQEHAPVPQSEVICNTGINNTGTAGQPALSTSDGQDTVKSPRPRVVSSGSHHYLVALSTQDNDAILEKYRPRRPQSTGNKESLNPAYGNTGQESESDL